MNLVDVVQQLGPAASFSEATGFLEVCGHVYTLDRFHKRWVYNTESQFCVDVGVD